MNKKKDLIKNTLVFGIVILFVGLAVQPGTANTQKRDINCEPEDFLFQTIIDIVNNKKVKNLLEQEMNNDLLLDFNYNFRSLFRKILFKDPNLLNSLIFTRPTFSPEYLNFALEKGYELTNLIGEDKVFEVVESITITNPKFSKSFSDIISNNEQINNKITEMKAMNQELKPTFPFEGNPIICVILLLLAFTVAIPIASFFGIIMLLSSHPFLGPLILGLFVMASGIVVIFLELIAIFC
ncbi:MAG: hypothetical protein AYK22_03385 [Thermoplasmatales archaeon SG8-52-3]|nr:MAG: hypothetical protein AYK22_03385 [Thermoplasmatales archaeon SG8-52-3]